MGKGKNLRGYPVGVAADESSSDSTGEGTNDGGLTLPDQMPSMNAVPVPVTMPQAGPAPLDPGSQPDVDLPDQRSKLEGIYSNVRSTDPERAAQVLSLQRKLNEPAAFIDKNLPDIQKAMASPGSSFFKQLEDQYPGTTKFLSDPKNMVVAQDDLDNTVAHEGLVNTIQKAWNFEKSALESGALQEELAYTRYGQVAGDQQAGDSDHFRFGQSVASQLGITETDPEKRAEQISQKLAELEQNRPQGISVKRALYGATEFLPQIAGGLGYGAKYAGPLAAASAAAGAATGPGEAAIIPTAVGVGMGAGEAEYNYKLMTGMSYDQLLKIKDADGKPLPDNVAKIAAISMGAAASGLSYVKLAAVLESVPGGKEFLTSFANQAGEKALENPASYGSALKNFAKNYVTSVAHGVGAMEGITAVNMIGAEGAKAASGQPFDHITAGQAASEFGQTAVDSALTFGALGLPGTMGGFAYDASQAKRAGEAREFYTALGNTAEASKIRARMPEAHRDFISDLTKDTPVENVYIPIEAATQYFQSKGLPVDQVMDELGVRKSFEEAKATGGDVEIPLATWTQKVVGTEHYDALANDIKFSPEDLTTNQVEQRREEIREQIQEEEAKAQAQAQGQPSTDESAAKVREQISQQLRAAGITTAESKVSPQLHEAFFKRLGEQMGVDPYELSQRFPLQIQRILNPDLESTRPEAPGTPESSPDGQPEEAIAAQSAYKQDVVQRIRDEVSQGTAEKGSLSYDQEGNVTGRLGAYSTYPDYFKNKGYTKKETLSAIDKHLSGKTLTDKQSKILGDLYHSSGYDPESKRAASEPFLQGPVSYNQSGAEKAPAAPFYSKLVQTVEQKMGGSASTEQINGMLKDIKPEERKWMGLDEFLKGKKKVSKEELLNFLRGNQLEIKEVTKGGDQGLTIPEGHYYKFDKSAPEPVQHQIIDPDGKIAGMGTSREEAIADLHRVSGPNETKFGQYTLPGGENYREMLFTLPENDRTAELAKQSALMKERDALRFKVTAATDKLIAEGIPWDQANKIGIERGLFTQGDIDRQTQIGDELRKSSHEADTAKGYRSSHWDEANVLAHTRLADRTDAEGKKVLHIEEIQSDWHQEGRKKGYKDEENAQRLAHLNSQIDELKKESYKLSASSDEWEKKTAEINKLRDERDELKDTAKLGVPDAPFKKTWHEFVLKRLIREAAEKGYDKIAWTPGEAQAERYDLSKKLDSIIYHKRSDGTFDIIAHTPNGDTAMRHESLPADKIEDYVGKELAQKITNGEGRADHLWGNEGKSLSGLDLKVGGEGMKGFYDKIIPEFLNKFGKKYDAKVGETSVSGTAENDRYRVEQSDSTGMWYVLDESGDGGVIAERETESGAEKAMQKLLDKEKTKLHSLDITPKLREAALNEGFSLFQPGDDQGPRGRIRMGSDAFNIDLFKTADRSTFLHETGHYFLEVLGKVAQEENAPQEVKDDYQTILKWLGAESPDKIGVEHHEKFARGFEAYLMEGNAPSHALAKAFDRFKNWLISVYKDMKNLHVELSDDIRGVMDRMLASREEIERAKNAIGYRAEDIPGITPEIAKRIRDIQEQARSTAENQLIKEQMGELKEKREEFVKSERERMTSEAESQIKEELPLYKAQEDIREATGKSDPEKLAATFLDGKTNNHESAQFEVQAEIHGFASGEDLAKKILDAKASHAFESEVKRRVDLGMMKYADLRNTDAFKVEALKAIHNDFMTELLAMERDAMMDLVHNASIRQEASRRRRTEASIEAKAARDKAKEIIADKPVKEAGSYSKYVTAERNAAAKVAKALAKKDYEAAAEAKRQQMLNHALASESIKAKAEAEKTVDYLSSFDGRGRDMKDMPYGFVRQIDQLLSRYGLSEPRREDTATLIKIARDMADKGSDFAEIANATGLKLDGNNQWVAETLPDFVQRANDNYYALTLPDTVMAGGQGLYKDMKLSELRDLKAAVKLISDTGKKYDRFLDEFIKIDMKQAATKLRTSVEDLVGTPHAESLAIGSKYKSKFGDKVSALLKLPDSVIPDMVNVLTLCHYLDGGKEDGPAKEFIYRPLKHAEDRKIERYEKMTKDVNAIFDAHYTPKELASYKEKRYEIPQLGRFMTREEILSMALNWGNEGNRDRIRRGFQLSDQSVHQILSHLDKKDWDFAQATWDHLDSYWPEIVAQEMKIRGEEPGRVDPATVETRFGSYRGGYYPIAYDFERSVDAYKNAEQKNALFKQYSAANAHTDTGHTQERVARVNRPVRLNMDVLFNHLENIVHDLEYRSAVIDVNRFINQRDSKAALVNSIGVKGAKSIDTWLKAVASDQGETLTLADKAFRWFRFNANFMQLGLSLKALVVHGPGNVANSMWEMGPTATISALKDFMMNPSDTKDFVDERSSRMAQRAKTRDRDMMDMSKKWSGNESALKQFAFITYRIVDEGVAYPLWRETYKRALSEYDERKAVDIADEAVTRTLGSGSILDQVGAQRGPESKKILSMMFSWASMMFNRAWLSGKLAGLEYRKENLGAATAILAKAAVYGWLMQAGSEALWEAASHNSQNTNDDDQKKKMAGSLIKQPFSYLWVGRDIAGYAIDQAMGEKNAKYELSPMENAVETVVKPFGQAAHIAFSDQHADEHFGESCAKSASMMLGYPNQLNKVAFNFLDWSQNNGEITWRDLLSRRSKK